MVGRVEVSPRRPIPGLDEGRPVVYDTAEQRVQVCIEGVLVVEHTHSTRA